jgi:predicted enzyme related to lactoylglutathione lyase
MFKTLPAGAGSMVPSTALRRSDIMPMTPKLASFVIDCSDPTKLAEFYRIATGWEVAHADADSAQLRDGGSVGLSFQRIEGYEGPAWPDKSKHYHLDLVTADVEASVRELCAAGAVKPEFQPGGGDWTVLADPEGHLFCVCPA